MTGKTRSGDPRGPTLLARRPGNLSHTKRPAQVGDPDRAEISVAGHRRGQIRGLPPPPPCPGRGPMKVQKRGPIRLTQPDVGGVLARLLTRDGPPGPSIAPPEAPLAHVTPRTR